MAEIASASALLIWLYLLAGRGAFWLCSERDDWRSVRLPAWPRVAVVVPARNEAQSIAESLTSLLRQDYPGPWLVIVADDDSSDGTAQLARAAAMATGTDERLRVIAAGKLPAGWTGKLWALEQGIAAADKFAPDYLLLTDADIVHAPDSVARLIGHAVPNGLVLTSLMAKLRCESLAERVCVPAFIFFFQMLYPFRWVNRPDSDTAAAAGGCMLVHADRLRKIGGIKAVRNALIDDCALARALKRQGPIWLALTDRVRSIRRYPGFADIRQMVARSAYAQLRYSPLLLAATIAAMALAYLAPMLLAMFGSGIARVLSGIAWLLMAFAMQPTLRFYGVSPFWGFALPLVALAYMLFTLDSAYQHARGRGGAWKGRVQANLSETR